MTPRPLAHGGFVTIDSDECITMHDEYLDAVEWARTHTGAFIYEAQFVPVADLLMGAT